MINIATQTISWQGRLVFAQDFPDYQSWISSRVSEGLGCNVWMRLQEDPWMDLHAFYCKCEHYGFPTTGIPRKTQVKPEPSGCIDND